jgi:hypothetical protein
MRSAASSNHSNLTESVVSITVGCAKENNSQVCTHDDEEIGPIGNLGFEELGVFNGLFRRVNRTWADDYKESVIAA